MILMVVPCFNEAARWNRNYWNLMFGIAGVEWLFVNDGSTDETNQLLDEISRMQNINVIHLAKNAGKAEAVRVGMNTVFKIDHDFVGVGFIDADGAFETEEVRRILEKSKKTFNFEMCDALWASRVRLAGRSIQRTPLRHYVGRVLATFFSYGDLSLPYDTQCGMKIFKISSQLHDVLRDEFRTRWLFELEIINRWSLLNDRAINIWEEPLNSWKEIGDSKITLREIRRIGLEVLRIKYLQVRTRNR